MANKTIYSDSYKYLIDILKRVREKAGITQEALAHALGEDQSLVSKVERRERRLDIDELRRFCKALGLSLSDIIVLWESEIQPGLTEHNKFHTAPENDSGWSALDWKNLLEWFVESGLLSYKEIASLTLGHLNPSQVGTSIASKKTFQRN